MESAPLTQASCFRANIQSGRVLTGCHQAYLHARNAFNETRKANPVAASEEHDLAAGEFAHAAQIAGDPEVLSKGTTFRDTDSVLQALRTLKLLEEHHKKLAQILKFRNEHPPVPKVSDVSTPASLPPTATETPISTKMPSTPAEPANQPPRLPPQNRVPHRDLTSSIASNLASARGIPPNQQRRGAPVSPTLSAQNAAGRPYTGAIRGYPGETKARKETEIQFQNEDARRGGLVRANIPPPILPSTEPAASPNPKSPAPSQSSTEDEPFQRFYSTFEGLISKLSAPLAFAGLPLSSPTTVTSSDTNVPLPKPKFRTSSAPPTNQCQDPDLTKLISRAALRAVKDTNSPSSFGYNAAESFYVVPVTGGTISYAGIVNHAQQEALRKQQRATTNSNQPSPFLKELNTNSDEEGDADFVDARETPLNQSPELTKPRHGQSRSGANTVGGKTMEELHLENQALKHLSDTLSKRLHMWEVNAQSSSAALQQSLRALQNSPKTVAADAKPIPADGGADGAALKRLQELEEMMKKADAEKERVSKENERLKVVVTRYRDRWEKLKEGARVRREGAGSGKGNSGDAGEEATIRTQEGET
jgi:hypothetical protein